MLCPCAPQRLLEKQKAKEARAQQEQAVQGEHSSGSELPPEAKEALAKLRQDNAANTQLQASLDRIEAVLEGREAYEMYDEESLDALEEQ